MGTISKKLIIFAEYNSYFKQTTIKMEGILNKFIAVSYKLYTVKDGKSTLVEEAPAAQPFTFISGYGIALDSFEKAVAGLNKGDNFDFTINKDEAYGDFEQEHIIDLDKSIFTINGRFDSENIAVGRMVPLQNEDGNRFYGKVLEITDEKVKMDLNHPLAGNDLHFTGTVIEHRDATVEEIQHLINHISGEGCGCGCGHEHGDGECHCHNGHHHHEGGCCCHEH